MFLKLAVSYSWMFVYYLESEKKILSKIKRWHFSQESSLKLFILKIPNYKEQNNEEI